METILAATSAPAAVAEAAEAADAKDDDILKRKRQENSRVCQIVGCEETCWSVHECRARACTAHCSAEAVELEGREPGSEFRYCYQCHKFHALGEFTAPDGSVLALHNCYGSQQRRLKRRKMKEQAKQEAEVTKQQVAAMENFNSREFLKQTFASSVALLGEKVDADLTALASTNPILMTLQSQRERFAADVAASVIGAGGWGVSGTQIAVRRLGAKAAAAAAAGQWASAPISKSPPRSNDASPTRPLPTPDAGSPIFANLPSTLPTAEDQQFMLNFEHFLTDR